MEPIYRNSLIDTVNRRAKNDGLLSTAIPNLQLFKTSVPNEPIPSVINCSLCLLLQGEKQIALHDNVIGYTSSEYLIVSVDLPIVGKVIRASVDKPYLAIKIDIDNQILSDLLLKLNFASPQKSDSSLGLQIAKIDNSLAESVVRYVKMLDKPEDIPILSDQLLREITYRVLQSDYGHFLSRVACRDVNLNRISKSIQTLKSSIDKPISVEELAQMSGMSVSSFHAHFKKITAMSPLQYQKKLRLIEARNLMLSEHVDATSAAYKVGYESPSQFYRDYARMFGDSPKRDIANQIEKLRA